MFVCLSVCPFVFLTICLFLCFFTKQMKTKQNETKQNKNKTKTKQNNLSVSRLFPRFCLRVLPSSCLPVLLPTDRLTDLFQILKNRP